MAYQPINLGDVLQQVGAVRGAHQKQQMNELALQQAQSDEQNRAGIDQSLVANPNANLGDLIKAGGGMAGVKASADVGQARTADLMSKYQQLYVKATQVAGADDPHAVAMQVAPDIVANYDQYHGAGAFAKLPPEQVKQEAAKVAQQAQMGMVDPQKAFEAHNKMVEDHYKQEGTGGELQRKQMEIASQNARTQFEAQQSMAREKYSQGQQNARDLKPVVGPDGLPVYTPATQAAGKQAFNAATYFPGGITGGAANGLTGADFLSSLAPTQATQVKALAEGRMAFPAGFALKSPYWQQMISAVSQYDPNFDAVNYNARAKTRNDFTSGKSAQNIKSLNTAIGHLGTLDSQISGTASHSLTPLNYLQNQASQLTGSAGPTQFKQTAGALASELTSVFRGSGGAEADVKRYLEELDPNASLAQKKAAVKNIVELLASRTAAIGDQYNQGMGTTSDPLTLLNPHARDILSRLTGNAQPQAAPASGVPAPIQSLLDKYK